MNKFQKAQKRLAKLKIAITGPSGSGKTLGALIIAQGLGGKTAVADTENNSACLYADRFGEWTYDVLNLTPPYTAQKYLEAIEEAEKQGYENLIIDSYSHVWAGEGGLLNQKEALDSRGGNGYTNWASITKLHEQLKGKLLFSNINIIVTMRSKQEYILEVNEKGKQVPKKVGLAPVQRDGSEYEFTVVFDVAMDHQYVVTKDRTGLFNGVVDTISLKTATTLNEWLNTADRTHWAPPSPEASKPPVKPAADPNNLETKRLDRGGEILNQGKNYVHPSDYIVRLKSKEMEGKKLRDIPTETIKRTLEWIKTQAKDPNAANLKEFADNAVKHLAYVGAHVVPPPFDSEEPLPDFNAKLPEENELDEALADRLESERGQSSNKESSQAQGSV